MGFTCTTIALANLFEVWMTAVNQGHMKLHQWCFWERKELCSEVEGDAVVAIGELPKDMVVDT